MASIDDLLHQGREEDYLLIEQMILSGQIEEARVQELLRNYPHFKAWLEARPQRRR